MAKLDKHISFHDTDSNKQTYIHTDVSIEYYPCIDMHPKIQSPSNNAQLSTPITLLHTWHVCSHLYVCLWFWMRSFIFEDHYMANTSQIFWAVFWPNVSPIKIHWTSKQVDMPATTNSMSQIVAIVVFRRLNEDFQPARSSSNEEVKCL